MVLAKLDGEFIVVNNQGWNDGASVGSFLQNLDEWDATWRSRFPEKVRYDVVRSTLAIPIAP